MKIKKAQRDNGIMIKDITILIAGAAGALLSITGAEFMDFETVLRKSFKKKSKALKTGFEHEFFPDLETQLSQKQVCLRYSRVLSLATRAKIADHNLSISVNSDDVAPFGMKAMVSDYEKAFPAARMDDDKIPAGIIYQAGGVSFHHWFSVLRKQPLFEYRFDKMKMNDILDRA